MLAQSPIALKAGGLASIPVLIVKPMMLSLCYLSTFFLPHLDTGTATPPIPENKVLYIHVAKEKKPRCTTDKKVDAI